MPSVGEDISHHSEMFSPRNLRQAITVRWVNQLVSSRRCNVKHSMITQLPQEVGRVEVTL